MRKTLRQKDTKKPSSDSEDESASIMLFVVVLVFGICYSFETIRRIMNYIWPEHMSKWEYYEYPINHLADIFYVLNSSVNFLIYSLFGSTFRTVFMKIFRTRFGHFRKTTREESNTENSVTSKSEASKNGKALIDEVGVSKQSELDMDQP